MHLPSSSDAFIFVEYRGGYTQLSTLVTQLGERTIFAPGGWPERPQGTQSGGLCGPVPFHSMLGFMLQTSQRFRLRPMGASPTKNTSSALASS